jgi:hypothetical protein
MLEKRQYHIVINYLKVLSQKDAGQYASEMIDNPYSDDRGWGYADVIRTGNVVNATLQKRIPTYYSIWNEEEQLLERQLVQIVKEIPFEMDFGRHLLLAEGTNTQLNHVKQSFRQVFWNEFVYEDINLLPVDYINLLTESHLLSSISELTINDFQFEDCLIGRYTAKPTTQLDMLNKIGDHAKNIIRAKLKVTVSNEECLLCVSNRNVIVLESSDDAKGSFVNYLKGKLN